MTKAEPQKLFVGQEDIRRFLEEGQHQHWRNLNQSLILEVMKRFETWPQLQAPASEPGRTLQGIKAQHIIRFLLNDLEQTLSQLQRLKSRYGDYSQCYSKAVSDEENRAHMLNYARELGASFRQIRGDKKAFKRWFGHDALGDRYLRRQLESERYLSFVLHFLGRIAAIAIKEDGEVIAYLQLWQRLGFEAVIKPLLAYEGDKRVLTAAFHALVQALGAMPLKFQHGCVADSTLRFIYHACLASEQPVWVQCEALQLLQSAAPDSLVKVFSKRLQYPKPDDDLFVRRKIVEIIGLQLPVDPNMDELLSLALKDPSPSVRQKIPAALNHAESDVIQQYYPALLFDDAVEQVRASALLNLSVLMMREDCLQLALYYLNKSLNTETEKFPLRVALKVCCDGLELHTDKAGYLNKLLPTIEQLHQNAGILSVRRWAAQTREYLLCVADEETAEHLKALQEFVQNIPPGKTRRIPQNLQIEDSRMGRLLSVIAQQDHGFDMEKGWFGSFITRGHAFGFRIWRLVHEFRHLSPDKRQAFSHTRGRLFWGTVRVPSAILSELAETKVPGEPLFMDNEEGWRGYLPLVDEVISALAVGNQPTWFFHPEGVTRLQPPDNFWRRWKASWRISYYFSEYARLRNWRENSQDNPQAYLTSLAKLGIQIAFKGHASNYGEVSSDPAVLRFFPITLPVVDMQLWQEFKDYFISVYENTLYELSVFMGVAVTLFLGRHLFLYRQIKKARNNLPLVLGGWGTRGKSGTERIKAALMNAMGYSIVSKTTGCEAMFLHAHPFGELREMFLFRPYDKATIWEQHNLVCLSEKLSCEVFLWECMGLTPSYIDILQRQWMCDDIATITNTYPDHEDLQGPAGINIPEVMTQFIPERSNLLTTEEQMLPILQTAARQKQTRFRAVTWLEAGMLAEDVLARFPYDEHPYNIALVMAMGEELGVDGDYALKEMADRVVADIGVLKTFPCAPWRSRRLEFVNGMSANERFGCLGNWQRMGFDKITIDQHPDTWITTVVNNRADRIARSRVFASIIVKDVCFDRCIVIGNNLTGMFGYIKESWDEWMETVSLVSDEEKPEQILKSMAQRFRIPHTSELLTLRIQAMLKGQNIGDEESEFLALIDEPEKLEQLLVKHEISHYQEILHFLQRDMILLESYEEFLAKLRQSTANTELLQQQFRSLLWQWFEQKIVIVEDYYATGNEVIKTICDETPPGYYNRILGMQNIKGTGLDFVYRWQAWEICHKACMQLMSSSAAEANKGLSALASFQEYGFLAKETVLKTVEQVKSSPLAQNERYQAELELIQVNLEQSIQKLNGTNKKESNNNSWAASISQALESFLDAGDAVKRRKKADQIYKDLVNERISHERAALELQGINKRQKGGWFNIK